MRRFLLAAVLAGAHIMPAAAATVEAVVTDGKGGAVQDAVVWAMPRTGSVPRITREVEIAQVDRMFTPLVSVIQSGSAVRFPNRDTVRHHVYSFSPAKVFEIKLYVGTPADPVVFDKPGEVVLGCNIHDDMYAYVVIVDSPWFGKTDGKGRARLEGLPPGEYELSAWHHLQVTRPERQTMRLQEAASATFNVPLRPPRQRGAPK